MAEQLDVYGLLEPSQLEQPAGGTDAPPRVGPGAPCDWCGAPIPKGMRADAEVCCVQHRKARWRFRRGVLSRSPRDASVVVGPVARFAYADPPYPGKAGYYPEQREVDHHELIKRLEGEFPDGWALSTSAEGLWEVLPLCPRSVRVCSWRRRHRGGRSSRPLSAWEPLLVPDALVGMKPPEFAVWMFQQLGARAGDELVDVFPGSGAVARAWELYTRPAGPRSSRDASGDVGRDVGRGDASLLATVVVRDASSVDAGRDVA